MSQIPFVNMLGDELERAAAQRGHSRAPRRRRFVLFALAGALAVGGTAAAATALFTGDVESQSAMAIQCYDGRDGDYSHPVASVEQLAGADDQSPVQLCARQMASGGQPVPPLVACSGRPSVAVIPGRRPQDCTAAGFAALGARYEPARARMAELERRILALEESADCIAPAVLARRVQDLIDRAGLTGWTTRVHPTLGAGRCGTVSGLGGDGQRRIAAMFEPGGGRHIDVLASAPRRVTNLLYSAERSLLAPLFDESGARCFTLASLRVRAEQAFAPHGIEVRLRLVDFPQAGTLVDADGRWTRYKAGCAVVAAGEPGADGRSAIIDVYR